MEKKLSLQKETISRLGGSTVTAQANERAANSPTAHLESSIHLSTTIVTTY